MGEDPDAEVCMLWTLGVDALRTTVSGRISLMAPLSSLGRMEDAFEDLGCSSWVWEWGSPDSMSWVWEWPFDSASP